MLSKRFSASTKEKCVRLALYAFCPFCCSFLDLAKFNGDAKSIFYFFTFKGKNTGKIVFSREGRVCKWETVDSSGVISCGPASTSFPHIVSCFYINYNLHYQLWVCSPANRKYCPWRHSFLYLFSISFYCALLSIHCFSPSNTAL